jgi:phosphoglucosamine mutase
MEAGARGDPAVFGGDGLRGVGNVDLPPELALALGRAVAATLPPTTNGRARIVVGRDPRPSSDMLEAAFVAGVCSAGADAVPVGVLPTPAVAFLTPRLGAAGGAVISASHNPADDNGIKLLGADGAKLSLAEEARLTRALRDLPPQRPTGPRIGRVRPLPAAGDAYVRHLVALARRAAGAAPGGRPFAGLRVVVDCANGAAVPVAPEVLSALGCELRPLSTDTSGSGINDGCGSTSPAAAARAVTASGADLGLAYDGDGDRLVAVDHRGAVADGDTLLAIFATHLRRRRDLRAVVTTVLANLGFARAMRAQGIEVVVTPVGDRHVLDAMRAGGHPLGGEPSGHLLFAEHAPTPDGLLAGVQLLAVLRATGCRLAELAAVLDPLPQVVINVPGRDRGRLDDAELRAAVQAEDAGLGMAGRALVRASTSEPVVRVLVEADSEPRARAVAERLAERVAALLPPASRGGA